MFNIGTAVEFSIRNNRPGVPGPRATLPARVVGAPISSIRPGTNINQSFLPVVSLREAADGRKYLRYSEEPVTFLSQRRGTPVEGLDDLGGVRTLIAAASQDFQRFLNDRDETTKSTGDELPPLPVNDTAPKNKPADAVAGATA